MSALKIANLEIEGRSRYDIGSKYNYDCSTVEYFRFSNRLYIQTLYWTCD